MAKESQMTRNNARYEPYNSSRRLSRRQGPPRQDNSGYQGDLLQRQPDTSLYRFLDDLYRRYGGPDLAQLFHEHAGQSGAVGEAIEMWLLFKGMRDCRQPDPIGIPEAEVAHSLEVPQFGSSLAGISDPDTITSGSQLCSSHSTGASPPVPLPCSRVHVVEPPERCIRAQHKRQLRFTAIPEVSPTEGARLRPRREQTPWSSPQEEEESKEDIVYLPQLAEVDQEREQYDEPVNWQDNLEESPPAAFHGTAGWALEGDYIENEGPSIPTHLKGKGKEMVHVQNEGGSTPEEQVSSGSSPPQPGSPAQVRPWLKGAVSYTRSQSLLPGTPIKVAPWAHDSFTTSPLPTRLTNQIPQVAHIMAAGSLPPPSSATDPPASHIPARLEPFTQPQQNRKRDVGAGDGDETGEGKPLVPKRRSRRARFETLQQSDAWKGKVNKREKSPIQPQLRRSVRIQERNKEGAAPPKAESPAKPASRKRAVRKK